MPKDPLAILFPQERTIFNIIYRAGQAGITRQALHERIYANRTNAADSASIISVHISNMNKKLLWLGLCVYSFRSNEATYVVRRSSLPEKYKATAIR